MKKRNYFAKKEDSSFLNLVKMITENVDDETEGLDFDDEADDMSDDELGADDEFEAEGEDDFDTEDSGDMVSIELPRDVAQQLYDVLGAMLGGDEDMADEDFDAEGEDDFDAEGGDEFGAEDDMADDFGSEEDEECDEMEDKEEEDEEEDEMDVEEDEEVLGSNQSNVAQSTISRDGAPKRSKANTSWNTGKTVKSVFDQTASGEGEPAGTSRDGAPKRSKFSKGWNNSKTVNSRLQPGKHAYEIGK